MEKFYFKKWQGLKVDLDLRLLVGDSCSGYFKHIESSFAEITFLSEESKYVLFLKGVGRFLCLSSHRGRPLSPQEVLRADVWQPY